MFHQTDLIDVARRFDLRLRAIHSEMTVSGSPERTTYRTVIEDDQSRLYVVQAFTKPRLARKRVIAETIAHLHDSGLGEALPFRPTASGDLTLPCRGHYWQVRSFLAGDALPRPQWVHEPWRGGALAELLLGVRRHSRVLPRRLLGRPFSIQRYVERILADMAKHHEDLLHAIEPIVDYLSSNLWPMIDDLPVAFCHGDVHPLNVIWGQDCILALIDWEFCGTKTEMYDLANLIGCVGIEDPDGLQGLLVTGLVRRLQEAQSYDHKSWDHLHELVLAIRFAWLAEWLRKDDGEMINLELDYMHRLVRDQMQLAHHWQTR